MSLEVWYHPSLIMKRVRLEQSFDWRTCWWFHTLQRIPWSSIPELWLNVDDVESSIHCQLFNTIRTASNITTWGSSGDNLWSMTVTSTWFSYFVLDEVLLVLVQWRYAIDSIILDHGYMIETFGLLMSPWLSFHYNDCFYNWTFDGHDSIFDSYVMFEWVHTYVSIQWMITFKRHLVHHNRWSLFYHLTK